VAAMIGHHCSCVSVSLPNCYFICNHPLSVHGVITCMHKCIYAYTVHLESAEMVFVTFINILYHCFLD
jgi:hypothetical protein